jgi:hypothetical protein
MAAGAGEKAVSCMRGADEWRVPKDYVASVLADSLNCVPMRRLWRRDPLPQRSALRFANLYLGRLSTGHAGCAVVAPWTP